MKGVAEILAISLIVIFVSSATAQEGRFFIPVEIQNAYERNTRSFDGKPGINYWQNSVDYTISVTLHPDAKLIEGAEEAVYYNNSPGDIKSLVVHLYQDVYKKGNTRLYPIDERDINNGVELTRISINGKSYDPKDSKTCQRYGTKIIFNLQEPLKSKSSLIFSASWNLELPSYSTFRSGAFDSTTFFAAYWYPQIAAYDDLFGWDIMDYNIRTEFYNTLGNFDVTITVPEKYVVWATGTLVNAEDVLPATTYDNYRKCQSSEDATHIISVNEIRKGFKSPHPIWHFTASDVTDFAFAVSDHHIWKGINTTVEGRKVLISSVLPLDTKESITDHLSVQQKALQYFSNEIPGIPYPFEAFTTFITEDGGGMEYPMMALNGGTDRRTTIHELFHSYFPMYVRLNERRWAWMDEGFTNYNTNLAGMRYFEQDTDFTRLFTSTLGFMGTSGDVPLITPSQYLIDPYYRFASYQTPELIFGILHHYLGEEMFIKSYREFIKRWAGKAPTPYDFIYTVENISGKDISWLWKPWLFEFGSADIKLASFEQGILRVLNKGKKPVPVFVEVHYKDGNIKTLSENAYIWAEGKSEFQFAIPDPEKVERISVNRSIMDINPLDNFFPSIRSWYKDIQTSRNIVGQYTIERYGTGMEIFYDRDLFYISIPRMNVSMIIYPTDPLNYISLDGSIKIRFNQAETGAIKDLYLDWNGKFHASKRE